MKTLATWPLDIRRASRERRLGERRRLSIPVDIERRRTQDRRHTEERRQQDLYAQSSQHAQRLCSELAAVPADNPILRLLVIQKFLLECGPRKSNEWIMRWARRLRATFYNRGRVEMGWAVFRALYGDR
jgi:hypothetical protein